MNRRALALFAVGAVLLSAAGSVAGGAPTGGQGDVGEEFEAPAFVVDLDESGTATVVLTFTFDLSDDTRRAAFEEIRDNQTVRSSFRAQFRDRFRRVAGEAANATGREMSVTDAALEFRTEGTTGVVEASATWSGLAAVDGDRLTVTEPFASGFTTERPVHVLVPDGYAVDSVTPTPDSTDGGAVTFAAGTDFTGFELVATGADGSATATAGSDGAEAGTGGSGGASSETPGESGPGFGLLAPLGALLAGGALVHRRR